MAEDTVVIANTEGNNVGATNTTPNSLQEVPLVIPCYKNYKLKKGDNDSKKLWEGAKQTGAGSWVKDLQHDLISFGIQKHGLIELSHNKWKKTTLKQTGVFDESTESALRLFQWHALNVTKRTVSGNNVNAPITFSGEVTGEMDDPTCMEIKEWKDKKYKMTEPDIGVPVKVNIDKFIQLYNLAPANEAPFRKLTTAYESNLTEFLGYVSADEEITDIRWVAYMLATAMHEGRCLADNWVMTWAPVKETAVNGKYHGGSYGDPEIVKDQSGHPLDSNGQRLSPNMPPIMAQYFGRGYVQLTHQDNYRKLDKELGLNGKIHLTPDEVLNIKTSYEIASIGMRKGLFSHTHKFSRYFNATSTNYTAARAMINGSDKAALIAHIAEVFEWMIYNSLEIK